MYNCVVMLHCAVLVKPLVAVLHLLLVAVHRGNNHTATRPSAPCITQRAITACICHNCCVVPDAVQQKSTALVRSKAANTLLLLLLLLLACVAGAG
jgi:hypothetical protein